MAPEESETAGYVTGMGGLDRAVRMMTAMLNRYNRAEVLILPEEGESFGEAEAEAVRGRIGELVNHPPGFSVALTGRDGDQCILISAEGYETPYACGGWFYVRRYHFAPDGSRVWTESPTCAMKRHRLLPHPTND